MFSHKILAELVLFAKRTLPEKTTNFAWLDQALFVASPPAQQWDTTQHCRPSTAADDLPASCLTRPPMQQMSQIKRTRRGRSVMLSRNSSLQSD